LTRRTTPANEGWVYNDNVNSPVIREWLGKVVGKRTRPSTGQRPLAVYDVSAVGVLRQFLP